jgi:predicted RNA-binding protein (virulence factor B family)
MGQGMKSTQPKASAAKATYRIGQQVDLVILRETDLGFVAKINGVDEGLLYFSEIFERLDLGQELPGYVKKIRPDGSIDIYLHPLKHEGAQELGEFILERLNENDGFLPVNSKSKAELIYDQFGVSRNKFKMALGGLYKRRLVTFTDTGTQLVKSVPKK